MIFYNYFFKGTETITTPQSNLEIEDLIEVKTSKKVVVLDLKSRDPFLGKITSGELKEKQPKENVYTEVIEENNYVYWPEIKYLGMIKKQNNKKICLLQVDKKFIKLQEKSKSEEYGFLIDEILKDSVIIKHKNEYKTFRK